MHRKPKSKRKHDKAETSPRPSDILDVHRTAALLTVSATTVYHLFATGQLPGRKVGRKWITTKAAVTRWIEASTTNDTLGRNLAAGDLSPDALAKAINSGKVRVRAK